MENKKYEIGHRYFGTTKFHWKNVDSDEFAVTRPTVIVLGGRGTDTDQDANGYAKFVENMLGSFKHDVDIFSIKYNGTYTDDFYDFYENVNELTNTIFHSLVSDDGKRIDVYAAAKNVRLITFFTHSFGDRVANNIMDDLKFDLDSLGYNEAEAEIILSQIMCISYGVDSGTSRCKKFCVISPNDEVSMFSDRAWQKLLKKYRDVPMLESDRFEFERISNLQTEHERSEALSTFYSSHKRCFALLDDNKLYLATTALHKHDTKDHRLAEMRRDENYEPDSNASKVGDYVSKCITSVLCNSVANSIINFSGEKLVELNLNDMQDFLNNILKNLNNESNEKLEYKTL